jgi:hypothetical protein
MSTAGIFIVVFTQLSLRVSNIVRVRIYRAVETMSELLNRRELENFATKKSLQNGAGGQ